MRADERLAPERTESRKNGANWAAVLLAFAAGAAAATVFLEIYGVSKLGIDAGMAGTNLRTDPMATTEHPGAERLLNGAASAADVLSVYARSFDHEAKTEKDPVRYRTVSDLTEETGSAAFVPDPNRSPVLAKASLIGKLPPLSGIPAAEVISVCAKNIDRALAARLIWEMSRGEAWSVGTVGGDVVAANSKSGAVRLIDRLRKSGKNLNVGLLQLNAGTLSRYGVSPEEGLEPCLNLQIGADRLGVLYEDAMKRFPSGGPLAAEEAVARFRLENFRSEQTGEANTLQSLALGGAAPSLPISSPIPTMPSGDASGASAGSAAGGQPKVSDGDPLRPSSSPADGLGGPNEAGSGRSGLIF